MKPSSRSMAVSRTHYPAINAATRSDSREAVTTSVRLSPTPLSCQIQSPPTSSVCVCLCVLYYQCPLWPKITCGTNPAVLGRQNGVSVYVCEQAQIYKTTNEAWKTTRVLWFLSLISIMINSHTMAMPSKIKSIVVHFTAIISHVHNTNYELT